MKKSLMIKLLASVFALSAIPPGAAIVWKNMNKEVPEPEITAGYTAMTPPPADNSLPVEHTGAENVSYMAYKLAHAEAYHTEAFSTVSTSVGFISYAQQVETYKDYSGGVMVVEDITRSSLVNTALQTCFVNDRALWRDPASSRAGDWNGRQTEWRKDAEPSNYAVSDYMKIYGLPCTEFSVYVLNENTLSRWSEVTDNGDGTYTQTVYPDTETAGQYYIRRMKTMGGLSDYPVFNSIEIEYTFDADWNVLSGVTRENYAIEMGVIRSDNCQAVTEQTYSYSAEEVDVSAYDDFFSGYVDKQSENDIGEGANGDPAAADYLSSAFAPVLAGPVQFAVTVGIDDKTLEGTVYADMGNMQNPELRAQIAGMPVWYTGGTVYVRVGGNLVCLGKDDIGGLFRIFGLNPEGDRTAALDFDGILSALSEGELTVSETGATLVAEPEIAGLKLPLTFSFDRNGKDISLGFVELTGLNAGEHTLSARLTYDTGEFLPALTAEQKAAAVDLSGYIDSVKDLINAEAFALTAEYQSGNLSVAIDATLNAADGTAVGDFDVVYEGVNLVGTFAYRNRYIYLTLNRAGSADLRVCVSVDSFPDFLAGILPDGENPTESLKDLMQIDWASALASLSVSEEKLTASVGSLQLEYTKDGKLNATAFGAQIGLQKGTAQEISVEEEEYTDLTPYLPDIISLIEHKRINGSGIVSFTVNGMDATLDFIALNLDWADGVALYAQARLEVAGTLHDIRLTYRNDTLSVLYGKIGVKVAVGEFDSLSQAFLNVYEKISSYYDEATNAEGEAAEAVIGLTALSALFSSDEINALLNSLTLNVDGEGALRFAFKLLSADMDVTYGKGVLNLRAENAVIGNVKTSFELEFAEGDEMGELPANVEYLTARELQLLCDYVLEVFEVSTRTEWNIDYTMTVNNADEAYAPETRVQYDVSGRLQIVLADAAQEKPFAAQLQLAIVSTGVDPRSYYIDFTVYEGRLYITVSYYASAESNPENYSPLYMSGELTELSKLVTALKTVLGYDLSFLDGILNPFLSVAQQEPSSIVVSDMIQSLAIDDGAVRLTLNGDAIYGAEGLENVVATLQRTEESSFVLSLNRLYYQTEPQAWMDMSFALSTAECSVRQPAGEFIDISTVYGLVDSLLDSFFTVSDNKMEFLDGYYFDGRITCSVGGYNLGFDVTANVLLSDGGIVLNATIAADSRFAVNSGRYKTYITMDVGKGMVYMMREQYERYTVIPMWTEYATPVVTYRSMTLQELGDDYWNQIVYMTNMGDTVAGIIRNVINGSDGGNAGVDYRNDVGTYLQNYSYADNAYRLTLNGRNFADFLGDMDLTLTCNDEGKIVNIAGSVNIYVTLSISLDYENVTVADGAYSLKTESLLKEWSKEGYEITVAGGHTSNADSLSDIAEYTSSLTLANGDETYKIPIRYGAPMSLLSELSDTDDARFAGWFTGENGTGERVTADTVDSGFGGGMLYACWIEKVCVTLDAGDGSVDTEAFKDAPEYVWQTLSGISAEREGYLFTGWYTADGVKATEDNIQMLLADGDITLHAEYKEIIKLTLFSDIESEGYEYDETTGGYYRVIDWAEGEDIPAAPQKEGYTSLGWWYLAEDGVWRQVTENAALSSETKIKAMWIGNTAQITADFSVSGRTVTAIVSDVSVYVSEEIRGKLTVSESFYYTLRGTRRVVFVTVDDTYTETTSNRTCSHTFGNSATGGSAEVTVTYSLDGVTVATARGNARG